MENHRLLMKAIVVLVLAVVANVTSSDGLTAEAPSERVHCAACFLEEELCEQHANLGCYEVCDGAQAVGSCEEYDPEEVECETMEPVYEYVLCDDSGSHS